MKLHIKHIYTKCYEILHLESDFIRIVIENMLFKKFYFLKR